jgi:hypothetical protein
MLLDKNTHRQMSSSLACLWGSELLGGRPDCQDPDYRTGKNETKKVKKRARLQD